MQPRKEAKTGKRCGGMLSCNVFSPVLFATFFSSHWLISFTNIKPKSVQPLKIFLVIIKNSLSLSMCWWNKICGAEKMTDNSKEIRPDTIPLRQRQQFLLQWVGTGGPSLVIRTSLAGKTNLLLNILPGSKYLLPLKYVNF